MAFGGGTGINITLGLNSTNFNRGILDATNAVNDFEKNVKSSLSGVTKVFDGLKLPNIGDGLRASANALIEFDAAMRNVNSIAMLNEEAFQDFSKTILRLNDTVSSAVGPAEAARAAYDILSSGFEKAADTQKILETAVIAGTAGMTDAAKAAQVITGVLNAYNMGADQASHVSDVLFNTVKYGVVTFDQLATTFGRVTPTAQANGIELEELSAAVATLTVKGIRANEAVTGIKRAITAVAAPTAQAQKTLQEYGITAGQLTDTLQNDGLIPTLRMLLQATGEDKRALRELLGESTAINAAFALAGKDAGGTFERINAQISRAGSTADAFAEQSKSVRVQMEQMKASLEAAGISIGGIFAPAMSNSLKIGKLFIDGLANIGDALPTIDQYLKDTSGSWQTNALIIGGVTSGVLAVTAAIVGLTAGFPGLIAGTGVLATAMAGLSTILGLATGAVTAFLTSAFALPALLIAIGAGAAKMVIDTQEQNKIIDIQTKAVSDATIAWRELNDAREHHKNFTTQAEADVKNAAALVPFINERAAATEKLIKAQDDLNKATASGATKGVKDALEAKVKDAQDSVNKVSDVIKRMREGWKKDQENTQESKLAPLLTKEIAQRAAAHKEWKLLQDKINDDFYKGDKIKEAKAIEEYQTKWAVTRAKMDRDKMKAGDLSLVNLKPDETDEETLYEQNRVAHKANEAAEKQLSDHQVKMSELMQKTLKKNSAAQYESHQIDFEEYIRQLRSIQASYKGWGENYSDDVADMEKKIQDVKKQYYTQQLADAKKHQKELYDVEIKTLDRKRKLNEITYLEQAEALAKMSQNRKFDIKDREAAADKAATAINNHYDGERKKDVRSLNSKRDVLKENNKIYEEEMVLLKEKTEAGLISQSEYEAAAKKQLAMKREELDLQEAAAQIIAAKESDPEERAAEALRIEQDFQAQRRQLDRAFVDQFSKNMDDIKKAKGEDIQLTEKQIAKQKELYDIVANEGKGAVQSLDQFVNEMNTRFGSENALEKGPIGQGQADRTSGLGKGGKAAAIKERERKRREYDAKFGVKSGDKLSNTPFMPEDLSGYASRMSEANNQSAKYASMLVKETQESNTHLRSMAGYLRDMVSKNGNISNAGARAVNKGDYRNGSTK